jgi:hypothetical protein
VHLRRGEQFDERRTVPDLGLTEYEPLGPDRRRGPGDGSELSHVGQPISTLGSDQDSQTDQATGPGPILANGAAPTTTPAGHEMPPVLVSIDFGSGGPHPEVPICFRNS